MERMLRDMGLTEAETKVFGALLDHGPSLAGQITRHTGIHRRNVYDCLERLIQKGLIGYITENNRKKYALSDPQQILEKVKQQERDWEELMPKLLEKYKDTQEKQETLFYRGIRGIRIVMEDQINTGEEVLVNATTASVSQILKHFFPKYQLLRKEKSVSTRMIFDHSHRKDAKELNELPLARVRYLKHFNKSLMSQYIYGEKVAIVVWSKEPLAILIRQPEVSQGFRENFEAMWKMASE